MLNKKRQFNHKDIEISLNEMIRTYSSNDYQKMLHLERRVQLF
jgi:hypothetical protein